MCEAYDAKSESFTELSAGLIPACARRTTTPPIPTIPTILTMTTVEVA